MKKNYFFYLLVTLFSFGFSQTIVTVDRANIVGPTATGNDSSISSMGFTRGSGVVLTSTQQNFTTAQWDAPTQAQAEIDNEYIEWSVTASTDNEIEITEIDIRTRKNANGPSQWQIFYSLDNFTTSGIAVTSVQTSADIATTGIFDGLSINSGTAGTITFRLYAWNAITTAGWFRIPNENTWSDYGITNPGLRLIGNITTTTTNSTDSDIVATTYNPSDNIDYTNYTATSGLTISNSIKVGEFSVRDGGATASDTDLLPTTLTDLDFVISNSEVLSTLAIFDGTLNIAEASVNSGTASFSGIIGISALDDSNKTFDVYATFNTVVTDNTQFQLTVSGASSNAAIGSSFEAFDAGAAQTPIAGDDNRIEVVATEVIFDQQPTDSNQFEIMTPYPTVFTVDSNGNLDEDYNGTVTIIAAGSMEPASINYSVINGIATLDTIMFTEKETVTTIVAFIGGVNFVTSDSFDIDGPLLTIAQQDFDGTTPEWSYTTSVASFDNGWGNGYYGVIDSALAAPLDNSSFSNNIFGENDLNNASGGTSDFATLAFDTIDISSYDNVTLSFDWDIEGYNANNDDAQYRLVLDGVNQSYVFLLDGNGDTESDQGTVSVDIDNSVSTISLEVRVRNNGLTGYSGFDNFKLVSEFDGLLYTNNGWSPNAPSSSTGAENVYVLDGEYTIGNDIQSNNFYINDGATTSISSQRSLTAFGTIHNRGTLELNSTSTGYSSLIVDDIEGQVIYNRHVNQFAAAGTDTGQNDLISAPVTDSNQTFLALRTANADIPSGTISGVPSYLFGPFNSNQNNYTNYTTADDTSLIESGIGYRTASIVDGGSTFQFVGTAETGTVAVPINIGTNSTFNLIGNPYPSYITLSEFLSENNASFNTSFSGVYGYVGNVDNGFLVWNQAYSDAFPSAVIAPGQGFLVSSPTGGANINFTPAMRTIGTQDDFIAGRSETTNNLAHLNLLIEKNDASYSTAIYFNDNASLSMDPGYDSEMFEVNAPSFSIYSHLVQDNIGKDLAVQSVGYSDLENVIIPLGINIEAGVQGTVSINESFIPEGIDVILEDNANNTFTSLLDGDYVFTPSTTLTDTGRFYIHFSTQSTLSDTDNLLNGLEIYAISKTITIKGLLESDTEFNLYDVQGRLVNTRVLNTRNTQNDVDVSNLTTGIYIVNLKNNTGNKTQKVIIK
ncbi:T9SS type A sorting domain-containing protein [Winogradskyella endarachnes]|uniref:T9SS type A sorting domain-containing protein n=1 Tax=Winogradskyella endarachnes TaxID=2681965 RepID=A0A6L6UAB9_9FLAO|nr:T9SS type A sorting domain-containing protein [Winogradskyella endarachnes]MUU77857.1 T9SS type A sorting domain-containing protein [Winogradskyella endarachnes]